MPATMLRAHRRHRLYITALTVTAGLVVLTGCGGGDSGGNSSGKPSGKLQILVSSADASDAGFKAVNEKFKRAYPDVDVVFSSVSNDNYPAAKSARLTARNVDIFVVKNFLEAPSYAQGSASDDSLLAGNGGLLDLTGQPFMRDYSPSVLQAQAYKGRQYAIPTGLSYSTGVYYNKDLFKKYGLTAPTTWSQLMNVCAVLQSHGVAPFGVGGKDGWPAGLPMLASVGGLYPTQADKQKLAKDLWEHTAALTDPGPLSVLQRTEKVLSYAQKNFAGAGYDEMPSKFAAQQFAMTVDGSWDQPTIDKAVAGKFAYGYVPLPTSDNAQDNAQLNGKIELQLAVSAGARNKTAALAWMTFFSDPVNYKTFSGLSGFSSSEPGVPAGAFLDSIGAYTKTFQPAWDQIWTASNKAGQAAVFPFDYPDLKPLGTKDAQGAAQAAQKDWKSAS